MTREDVLDHGFVELLDTMGDEAEPARAARISYGRTDERPWELDAKLIRYLHEHRHCYAPEMQVLTTGGWKRWDECAASETFLVPDPADRSLRAEHLPVEVFPCSEELITFENQRMSFAVTSDHRMWFRGKYADGFEIVRAAEMGRWGHFDPLAGYSMCPEGSTRDPRAAFAGFYLGDGSYASAHRVSFHLKKARKVAYLEGLVRECGLTATKRPSSTHPDGFVYYVTTPEWLAEYVVDVTARTAEKAIREDEWSSAQVRGLFEGLCESDGCRRSDRPQIAYSSVSPYLRTQFQALAAMQGIDAHEAGEDVTAYLGSRTSLEARADYFGRRRYEGPVYCATTSTGLLVVRGGPGKFGFVCGNTSPFEMVETKWRVRLPIFVAREWVRHRTASLNEFSQRYADVRTLGDGEVLFYAPEVWRAQDAKNKQGSAEALDEATQRLATQAYMRGIWRAIEAYEQLLDLGVAREQARIVLPLSTYTEMVWKIDLHNLLHFLALRTDATAQAEFREYALAMERILRARWPRLLDLVRPEAA